MDKRHRYEIGIYYLDKDNAYMSCTSWEEKHINEFLIANLDIESMLYDTIQVYIYLSINPTDKS